MVKSSLLGLALSAKVEEYDIAKQNWPSVLVTLVAAFIGAGIGVCVALWFKLPDHTVDVFAFVESAVGIGFTVAALIITLGILRQRTDFENMLLTRRDEMEAAIQNRIENGTVSGLRNQYVTEFNQLRNRVDSMVYSYNSEHDLFLQLHNKVTDLEKKVNRP